MAAPPTTPTSHARILALAVPATLALAADPLLSLVDTALVGRLDVVAVGALGVNVAVFAAAFIAFNFLTYGTTAEVARLRGAGRGEEAAARAVQALWLAVGLGIATTIVLLAAAPQIVALMGAEGDLVDPSLAYLRIRALASVPVLIVYVGHGLFRGLEDTTTPLVLTVAVNVLNAVASAVLIFMVGMGVAGAALGTLGAQTLAAAAFLLLARRRLGPVPLRIDPPALRRIVTVSRDLFIRTVALLGALLVTTAVATRMGTATVAAHHVARELWLLSALVLDGFAIAGQALIAGALGAGDVDRARVDARRLLWWGTGFGVAVGIVYAAGSSVIPRLLTDDAAVLSGVAEVMWIVAALQLVGGAVFVLDGILMGAGDFRFLRNSIAVAALGGLIPVSVASLAFGWGLTGVWAGMSVLMVVRLVTLMARLRSGRWHC